MFGELGRLVKTLFDTSPSQADYRRMAALHTDVEAVVPMKMDSGAN